MKTETKTAEELLEDYKRRASILNNEINTETIGKNDFKRHRFLSTFCLYRSFIRELENILKDA